MHVLVTRPEPEGRRMAARLAEFGIVTTLAPLLDVEPCLPPSLALDGVVGVVATSRSALSALQQHSELGRLTRLPLFAVGPGTAEAARRLGFSDVHQGAGAGAELLPAILQCLAPEAGAVLVLRGENVAFDMALALAERGYATRAVVSYRTRPVAALPEAARALLSQGRCDGVVLMSPDTAKVFTKLVQGADLIGSMARLTYFCLSRNVALAAAVPDGSEVVVPERPNLEEMLALLARKAAKSGPPA